MGALTVGKVAAQTGIGIETIRFYERRGLIESPPRRPSGYRDYPIAVLERLRFIQRAKALGFSLAEVSELLTLRVDTARSCGDVLEVARAKVADIDERIRALKLMRGALERMASQCEGDGPTSDCPILEGLAGAAAGGG